jgi:NADH:ubiquinone oxidoreductase subunit 6 (subunit J)
MFADVANPDVPTPAPSMELTHLWLTLALGGLAVYLLLPRPQNYSRVLAGFAAVAALVCAGVFLVRAHVASAEVVLFYIFAAIAISGGVMMLAQSNPVHAALSFALVVLSSCGLFLLQAAGFLMAATITVYAGAIIVIFLFVIMLAQQSGRSDADHRSREPLLASIAGFVLLAAILYLLNVHYDTASLDTWLARLHEAQEQTTVESMVEIVAPDREGADNLLDQIGSAKAAPIGFLHRPELKERISLEDYKVRWEEARWNGDVEAMRTTLVDLEKRITSEVRDTFGSMKPSLRARPLSPFAGGANGLAEREAGEVAPGRLPAENTAYLGRTLFTDFLIAVELAGTLLLITAVGAIAITHRREEETR